MPGLGSLLTILFAWAKIEGKIDWSWWVVFAPVWGQVAAWAAITSLLFVLLFANELAKFTIRERREKKLRQKTRSAILK